MKLSLCRMYFEAQRVVFKTRHIPGVLNNAVHKGTFRPIPSTLTSHDSKTAGNQDDRLQN